MTMSVERLSGKADDDVVWIEHDKTSPRDESTRACLTAAEAHHATSVMTPPRRLCVG
jgi:hypothetical protein